MGGDFRTVKDTTVFNAVPMHLEWNRVKYPILGPQRVFDGEFSPQLNPASNKPWTTMPTSLSFNGDLDAKGTEAITLCNPLNPVGDAATFLAEALGERIPSLPGVQLWKGRTKALLGVANEFLNAEFGWLPMLREIGDFSKAIQQAALQMEQYQRDAGKLVRRSWYFPIEKSETRKIIGTESVPLMGGVSQYPGEAFIGYAPLPFGRVVETKQTRRKCWFKGAFTYPIPDQSDAWSNMMSAASGSNATNVALGSNITPETLWELTPWSWALDWFSNAQEVVSNLQLFELEGLVMPYGYIMDEKSIITTFTWEAEGSVTTRMPLSVSTVTRTNTSKMRKQASPFGFGLEWNDLSVTQLAILAALGITLAL